MIILNVKTPLLAAFFCAMVLSACTPDPQQSTNLCSVPSTPVAVVQGDGFASPLLGQIVTLQGIVTLIRHGEGLYLEQLDSDADPRSSNAIFIKSDPILDNVTEGDLIALSGIVAELGESRDTQTALTGIVDSSQCASDQPLPLSIIKLPLDSAQRESLEGMRVQLNGPLVVTDVYQFDRGNVTLSANGLQYVATEVVQPGGKAIEYRERNRAHAIPVNIPADMSLPGLIVNGTPVGQFTGIMGHDKRGKRVFMQSFPGFSNTVFSIPDTATTGLLRVVGMNLHNYFNGDGKGAGFPTPRGAETIEAFQHQRARIGAAVKALDPHLVAVMELENDGFGKDSAAQDLIQLAEDATGRKWQVTRPVNDDTGSDAIAVGIFYRADKLQAIGPSQTLKGREFEASRQPQAQLFQRLDNGEKLLVVINHLKSKGSCPKSGENANQNDGQGCWNPMRLASAQKMSAWAKSVAATSGTDNILILGDMNAYRNEEPIEAIRQSGFTELVEAENQHTTYSFTFYGQHGTLDYAFGSKALLNKVQRAYIWQVNSTLPGNMELPEPWLRFSDHDPVVVDLL